MNLKNNTVPGGFFSQSVFKIYQKDSLVDNRSKKNLYLTVASAMRNSSVEPAPLDYITKPNIYILS